LQDPGPSTSNSRSSQRKKKSQPTTTDDPVAKDNGSEEKLSRQASKPDIGDDSTGEGSPRRYDDDEDEDDPFTSSFLGGRGPVGLSSTLRALTGMMAGVSSRFRAILENLKQKDDPSVQLIALQELSELLLISTEDHLAGHFHPDPYVKELVTLMQPSDFDIPNPEIMLLACRCLANLMEALPAATANVVYSGAVPILCQKLLEIDYIDLAEQSLSVG
jgi:E3 ubiquitin-protein ligase TRIP12